MIKKYRVLLPFNGWEVDFCEYDGKFENGKIVILESVRLGVIYGLLINEIDFDVNAEYSATTPEKYELDMFWSTFSSRLLETKLELNDRCYEAYKTTKKNKNTDRETAELKVKRNLLMSYKGNRIPVTDRLALAFQYGYMRILFHKGRVVNITFKDKTLKTWRKNMQYYNYYTELLGIKE